MLQVAGKYLVVFGLLLVLTGLLLQFAGKIPFLGKLPGDILIKREGFTFYFPVTTCIFISVILSVVFYIFYRK